jgi:transcriptional regulator with XRE-family HTH domain
MKLRDQLSLSEIAKRTGLARNTVKKWLKAPGVPSTTHCGAQGKTHRFRVDAAPGSDDRQPSAQTGRRSDRLFAQIRLRVTAVATAP